LEFVHENALFRLLFRMRQGRRLMGVERKKTAENGGLSRLGSMMRCAYAAAFA
jgi:hypothetical protein